MWLSPDVVDYFKSGGEGWQSRLDEALKVYIARRHDEGAVKLAELACKNHHPLNLTGFLVGFFTPE
ncbi:MAG: hypothetical protein CR976_02120 [Thiotrichales bacterium]|nr:MAG: hypothetical protein CR976_02120 [Thiotrichales bacterium]